MSIMQRVVKPATHRGKKVLESREPKLIEDIKQSLFLRGRKTPPNLHQVLKDLYVLKSPDGHMLKRKNDIVPFEDASYLEILAKRNNCPLFFFGSHSKKRPNNLIIGRMFDRALLDMFEMEVSDYIPLAQFKNSKITAGIKPCLVFSGPQWEQSADLTRLRSLLIDSFQREKAPSVRLQGLEHVISFTATPDGKICFKSYRILLKKSGTSTPRVELEEIGPSMDLRIRRVQLASDDLYKLACKQPKALKQRVKKNISSDKLGSTHGRIHLGKQNIGRLQTRKMKGLKKTSAEKQTARKNLRLKRARGDSGNASLPKRSKLGE